LGCDRGKEGLRKVETLERLRTVRRGLAQGIRFRQTDMRETVA